MDLRWHGYASSRPEHLDRASSNETPPFAHSQVLQDVGMDAGLADEVMCAASADGSASATDASPPSTRSVSYEDFRRLVLAQPPGVVTKVRGADGV